jgi:hypothetical protein
VVVLLSVVCPAEWYRETVVTLGRYPRHGLGDGAIHHSDMRGLCLDVVAAAQAISKFLYI